MNRLQAAVLEFNKKGGQYVAEEMGLPPEESFKKQVAIANEEWKEMIDAFDDNDTIEVIDGAVDTLYVLLHFFNMLGLDLDPLFDEVHRSNMSKADPVTGEFIIKDGKIQKGPNYSRPNLEKFLKQSSLSYQMGLERQKNIEEHIAKIRKDLEEYGLPIIDIPEADE